MKYLVFVINIIFVIFFSQVAFGQADNVGILPTSRLYFIKEWRQGIQKFFTFDSFRKAELDFDFLKLRAGELKKLNEINPDNVNVLAIALNNYQESANRLARRLEILNGDNRTIDFDNLINDILEQVLKQQDVLDALMFRSEFSADFKLQLDKAQGALIDILAVIVQKEGLLPGFNNRFIEAVKNEDEDIGELKSIEILDRLEEKLKPEDKESIFKLEEELLIRFAGRLESQALLPGTQALLPKFDQIPGDRLRHVKILDEIKEIVVDSDLKSQVNIVRQSLLEKSQEAGLLNSLQAELAMKAAKNLLKEAGFLITGKDGVISKDFTQFMERVNFSLKQAQELFEQGNYSGSYGQALAASAVVKNILMRLPAETLDDRKEELMSLRKSYDELLASSKEFGLDKSKNLKLFDLFGRAEKKIAELSKTIKGATSDSDKIVLGIRNVKLLLATIESLRDLILKI